MKLLYLMLLNWHMNTDTTFYEKVLNNFEKYSFFISIRIKTPTYEGLAIIENDDLTYYFNQKNITDTAYYKLFIKKILINNEALNIDDPLIKTWGFLKSYNDYTVNQNAKKGVDEFVKIYFNGTVLKDGISEKKRFAIISKLFEFKILSKYDDETGYLIINR